MFQYNDEGVWRDLFGTLETVDATLLGAGMHQEYLSHWYDALINSTAGPDEKRYADLAARMPHFVLSRSLREVEGVNVNVLPRGVDGIADFKKENGRDIIMWGGPTAAAAAIEAGVVDEYHLVTHPVIAGRGKKLLGNVLGDAWCCPQGHQGVPFRDRGPSSTRACGQAPELETQARSTVDPACVGSSGLAAILAASADLGLDLHGALLCEGLTQRGDRGRWTNSDLGCQRGPWS